MYRSFVATQRGSPVAPGGKRPGSPRMPEEHRVAQELRELRLEDIPGVHDPGRRPARAPRRHAEAGASSCAAVPTPPRQELLASTAAAEREAERLRDRLGAIE